MPGITENDFAGAVDSRCKHPIYSRMKAACIGIAGLGGLGSNIAAALARSGTGKLVIADHDVIELSNINRQLYTPSDVGRKKAETLAEILHGIDPFCEITVQDTRVTAENCTEIFSCCDIIIEALDRPDQKAMLVNTVLEKMPGKYLISGSGMAGYGRANDISTRKISPRFTICGDMVSDTADGWGLTASRVMICAGHMASRAVEIILEELR